MAIVAERTTRTPEQEPPFTEQDAGKFLNWLANTSSRLVIRVGKIGRVSLSRVTEVPIVGKVDVTYDPRTQTHYLSSGGREFSPCNSDHAKSFVDYIDQGIKARKKKIDPGQPTKVLFDQTWQ